MRIVENSLCCGK